MTVAFIPRVAIVLQTQTEYVMVPPGVDLDSFFTIWALMHSTPVWWWTVGDGLGDGDLLLVFDGLGDGVLLLEVDGLGEALDETEIDGEEAGLVVVSEELGLVGSGLGLALVLMISEGSELGVAEGLSTMAANKVALTAAEACAPDPHGELAFAAGAAFTAGAARAGAAVTPPIRKPAPTTAAASPPARIKPLGNAAPRRSEPASAGLLPARSFLTPDI